MCGQLLIDDFLFIPVHSGRSDMTDRLRGGRSNWLSFVVLEFELPSRCRTDRVWPRRSHVLLRMRRSILRMRWGASSSNPPPPDRLERQLARRSSFRSSKLASASKAVSGMPLISIPDSEGEGSPEGRRSPAHLDPVLQDDSAAASRKRRRSSKAFVEEPPRSKRKPKGQRFVPKSDGSVGQDDLVLARRTRSLGCHSPCLASPEEEGAYAKVVVASSKVGFVELHVFII
ncbi:hypothetical protein YC2023_041414 [Brassica napus]